MKRTKKTTIILFLPLFLLIFSLFGSLGYIKVFADSTTGLDETTATIKVTSNSDTAYYESFSDAVSNVPVNSTITLLKDTNLFIPSNLRSLRCFIDLNGNTLSGGGTNIYGNTLTILDSKGTGKITGNVYFFESSNITIKSAGTIDYFYFVNSRCSVLGGKIDKLAVNIDNTNISGGEINNLLVYRENSIHLSGGTINNFKFVSIPENFNMLDEGYIYTNKTDLTPIKTVNMTNSTSVTIVKCSHPAFTGTVCDYCNYVCDHFEHYDENGVCEVCGYVCHHENGFNSNGICEICNYACLHTELNDSNVCLNCNNSIEANIKSTSTNKNYIKIEDAIASLSAGDTLTLCNNVTLNNSFSINITCNIDLNGYSLEGYYLDLCGHITITDSKGNGYIAISAYSNSSQIELKGAPTTFFSVMTQENRLKFYSGKIIIVTVYNSTIDNILPNGYIFVKHEGDYAKKLTKQETNIERFYVDNCYLTCEVCSHDSINEDLSCEYCGNELTQEQISQALIKELQKTKEELQKAKDELQKTKNELLQEIAKKEDITTINEKVETLNNTIASTENICKQYANQEIQQTRLELINLINEAKLEAITSSNTALELAKNNLTNMIDKKLDIQTFNLKVTTLTQAINNAEIASKAYADSKDTTLKTELQNKINQSALQLQNEINQSKTTLQNANNEINARLTKAENNIDKNTKTINSLKTALIVISVVFAILLLASFVLFYILFFKKNKNSTKA